MQVKLDESSSAVVEHGAGKIPTAVIVQTGGPGQLASIVPGSYTDKTFKVKFNWHDGATFKPGTLIRLAVMVTYEADAPAPPVDPAPGRRCEFPIVKITELRGRWQDPAHSNVGVLNEVWNAVEAGPQTMNVCDATSWFVETNQPKMGVPKDRFGAVKSYPCTQVLFSKLPIAGLKTMTSSFAHKSPELGLWNWAYDIWIGGLGSASTAEVMIWPDYRYAGPLPPSGALKTDTVTLGGVTYVAWTRKNSNGGDYIALVAKDADQMRSSGVVDLLAVFRHLTSLGWLKPADTVAAVNYGVEVCSTEQVPATFYLDDFQLAWT